MDEESQATDRLLDDGFTPFAACQDGLHEQCSIFWGKEDCPCECHDQDNYEPDSFLEEQYENAQFAQDEDNGWDWYESDEY